MAFQLIQSLEHGIYLNGMSLNTKKKWAENGEPNQTRQGRQIVPVAYISVMQIAFPSQHHERFPLWTHEQPFRAAPMYQEGPDSASPSPTSKPRICWLLLTRKPVSIAITISVFVGRR